MLIPRLVVVFTRQLEILMTILCIRIACYHRLNKILMISKWKYFKTENQCNKLFYDIPTHAISMLLNNTVYEKCKLQCTLNCYHKCS